MKNYLILMLLAFSGIAYGQNKPVKIVFDVTSKDTLTHQAVLRHINGMASSYPNSSFEVVVYGAAVSMFQKDKSTVSKDIETASTKKNVSFVVCEQAMKRHNIDKSQLLPGIVMVPDGILEIVTKQGEGWGYIKEAHH
jgi:intracellular sulfur oxidation DsrE/DsrF family protein